MTAEDVANRFVALEAAVQSQSEQHMAMMATLQSLATMTDIATGQSKSTMDVIREIESWIKTQVANPPMSKDAIGELMDAKLQTARALLGSNRDAGGGIESDTGHWTTCRCEDLQTLEHADEECNRADETLGPPSA